ncbi:MULTISPECIES: LysE family transporter [Kyrpidia]|uniref:Amino-acid transporter YisU n=1 Tax=Kyrpidia spormannii TaxID=2055160 RepID=A0ACA8Z7U2_9BACL|nr:MULTISPECIES: LysE family transporter [Kyrpidia]MCL6577007.1 LysE family transporter [Kyrpidia sp.]CAB3390327.1 putative amino-acid transporter YisU [Kyrpidia spormannii]HHY67996.1 LysE family transporter [Alicyclobacillus sp.]
MLVAFLHGLILSLGLILPIGMQNGFILTQGALHRRWSRSLPAVITAGICDTLLIVLAVVGVSTAALHVPWLRGLFGGVGIAFMLYMGISTWRDKGGDREADGSTVAWPPRRQVGFTVSVSLLNPHALIDTLVVVGGAALAYSLWPQRLAFGLASVMVSWLWFFALSMVGHAMGRVVLRGSSLLMIQRISAVMMWASAVYLGYILYTFS